MTRHLSTGLAMLHRQKRIRLSQRIVRGREHIAVLRVGDEVLVVDMNDTSRLDETLLAESRAYVKRSYRLGGYGDKRVHPYGLSYSVHPPFPDPRVARRRGLPDSGRLSADLARAVGLDLVLKWPHTPRVSSLCPRPMILNPQAPMVAFFTRVWSERDDGAPTEQLSRPALNALRAACIRALLAELGPRFIGGLSPTPLAQRKFADCVVDATTTTRRNYLRAVSTIPIGVTTTGLLGSVGWKLGEFVAYGRAVVTERLHAEIPRFAEGTNYLAFTTAEQCVEACVDLIDHPERIEAMGAANVAHYDYELRPDHRAAKVLGLMQRSSA